MEQAAKIKRIRLMLDRWCISQRRESCKICKRFLTEMLIAGHSPDIWPGVVAGRQVVWHSSEAARVSRAYVRERELRIWRHAHPPR